MPTTTDYVVRETASNLWRNRLMTFAAILTAAVSLSLVGASLLLKQGTANAASYWQRGTQVTVWMQPTASAGELKAVKTQLAQLPYVDHPCVFRDHQYDFREARQLLGNEVPESGLTPAKVPTSFHCTPKVPDNVTIVIRTFYGQPGVLNVTAPVKTIHSMERFINDTSIGALVVAVALVISAIVLILNTIRMAIFARRREVSVMKLVGATNWFIRIPFISEGMVQGLTGSAIAAAIVYGIRAVMNAVGSGSSGSVLIAMRLSGWQVFGTDAVVIIVGIAIGSIGSAMAIRRFLDV